MTRLYASRDPWRCAAASLAALCLMGFFCSTAPLHAGRKDGLLYTNAGARFPIGSYEIPKSDEELKRLAESGVNLVQCRSRADLDRAAAVGMMGWVSLHLQQGATEALRRQVTELRDHPALAVWEGPDEIVWTFTAYSALERSAGITRDDWWSQKPKAVAYGKREAEKILPKMREAIAMVREIDASGRPIWINEAGESDVLYVRRYMDVIDITGCDFYPVKATSRDLATIGKMTNRWRMTGRGKPVWMVLQAFSWHRGNPEKYKLVAYPTFADSRFMVYAAIVHGARGVIHWGSSTIDKPEFRESIGAVTAELSALQPFLVAAPVSGPRVRLIEADLDNKTRRGVSVAVRKSGDDWIIVLVNEDDSRHMGVELTGLERLNGRDLHLLYGDESATVTNGELVTRLQGFEVKVFATDRRCATPRTDGRDFK